MNKLSIEERESLAEFMTSPAWNGLLKLIENLAERIDSGVMKYNLDNGDRGLVIERARADGSRKLQLAITNLKKEHKKLAE
jgi:hypothetical protein